MKILFEAEFFREDQDIIGYAKSLDVSSAGKTPEEAERALTEAVTLFIETAQEMGTLEQLLVDSGFVRKGDEWSVPRQTDETPLRSQFKEDSPERRLTQVVV
jgi:predicted RNase H-like HicB family nuclease